jgi:hypothetical protein
MVIAQISSPTKCARSIGSACWPNHIALTGGGSLQVALGRCGYSTHDLHKNKFANAGSGVSKYPWIVKHLVRKIGNCLLEKPEISYIQQ